VRRVCI